MILEGSICLMDISVLASGTPYRGVPFALSILSIQPYLATVNRQFRKTYRRFSRFTKTSFMVALHICLSGVEQARPCWMRLVSIAWQLVTGFPASRKTRDKMAPIFLKRIRVCRTCPVFDRRFKTCGTPGNITIDQKTGNRVQCGCWCIVTSKSFLPEATCWAWDKKLDVGWPDELNNVQP